MSAQPLATAQRSTRAERSAPPARRPGRLEVRDLRVRTSSGALLLDGVSWTAEAGRRLGVIGESGSGKSLTVAAVLGLLPDGLVADGHVLLDGVDLLRLPERRLRSMRGAQIATVFQEPLTALDPLMTVGRQLAGPLRRHRHLTRTGVRAAAVTLCRHVRLDDAERVLTSYPWQLSGGQRQRVGIALALACEPSVLLADEPTTALDVTVQADILALLDEIVEERGMTLVLVSHDLPVVAHVATDLVVMRHGRVVETGPATDLVRTPTHDYTRDLLRAARAIMTVPSDTTAPNEVTGR